MTGSEALSNFLRTDPRDVGCDRVRAALHVYADLAAAGHEPGGIFPGVAAHLAACGSCADDFTGLLTVLTNSHDPGHSYTEGA